MPIVLLVFYTDTNEKMRKIPTLHVMEALEVFDKNLHDYFHLVLPPIVNNIRNVDISMNVRMALVASLERIIARLPQCGQFASTIIQNMLQIICETDKKKLQDACIRVLTMLLQQILDSHVYVATITKSLSQLSLRTESYDLLISTIMSKSRGIHTYIHTYMHAYIHTCIHTCT